MFHNFTHNKYFFLSFLLVACGGGGGSSSTPEIPNSSKNNAPFFINTISEIEIDELQTEVVTIEADDADGDIIRYSLSGDDPSYFSISSNGKIMFNELQAIKLRMNFLLLLKLLTILILHLNN